LLRRIRKGETLILPILAINRATSLWGEDAMEFRLVLPSFLPKVLITDVKIDQSAGKPFRMPYLVFPASGVIC
jgi:hypothetical protein